MTIASKTRLLSLQFSRAGRPFADVSARANFDGTEAQRLGAPFYGVGNEETLTPISTPAYSRLGAPFKHLTAKASIDASEFDFSRSGAPFWVPYGGPPPEPPAFNASRFFLLF